LVVSVTSRRVRFWDDFERDENFEEERPYLRNVKRACNDYKSSSYCRSVGSRNECGIHKYRMYCRKTCGSC
nr:RecName: Full=U-actitoxin-Avd11a; Short=U-AITX-Avd11a; AltName: Full=Potassium channel toxin avtx-11; Flags: Precursor [Anemonia viridis]